MRSHYGQDGVLRYQSDGRRNQQLHYIYLNGSLVATRATSLAGGSSTIRYQHTDALGSPVAVTDHTRTVTERSEYEPYGHLLNRPISDGPGYTGHVADALSGLSYLQQRYYDPAIGRFLSVDPVTALDNGDLRHFNRYAYAFSNPYTFTEPDGRVPMAIPLVFGGIRLGVAAYRAYRTAQTIAPAVGAALILNSDTSVEAADSDEPASVPPTGSKPIDQTPWSGDHGEIKGQIGAGPRDKVKISPNGEVWVQNPDGTWTNYGDAGAYTGSGRPSGEKGKDRDRERDRRRNNERERERERLRESEHSPRERYSK